MSSGYLYNCVYMFFFSSPSWDTSHCSSAPFTLTCTVGTDSSTPLPTSGSVLLDTCFHWWFPQWCWFSNCCSSCPVWTEASLEFDRAGRGLILKKKAQNHCFGRAVTITNSVYINRKHKNKVILFLIDLYTYTATYS